MYTADEHESIHICCTGVPNDRFCSSVQIEPPYTLQPYPSTRRCSPLYLPTHLLKHSAPATPLISPSPHLYGPPPLPGAHTHRQRCSWRYIIESESCIYVLFPPYLSRSPGCSAPLIDDSVKHDSIQGLQIYFNLIIGQDLIQAGTRDSCCALRLNSIYI